MTGCYIYYKVAPERVDEGAALIARVFADVRAQCGIAGRLLARADDRFTWMEIYEPIADWPQFEHGLEAALARHAFDRLLAPGGRRMVERFEPIAIAAH